VLFGDRAPKVHPYIAIVWRKLRKKMVYKRLNLPLEIRILVTYSYIRKLKKLKIKNHTLKKH
jgi:hypothetical protein